MQRHREALAEAEAEREERKAQFNADVLAASTVLDSIGLTDRKMSFSGHGLFIDTYEGNRFGESVTMSAEAINTLIAARRAGSTEVAA
jgi:hypothetical protein